MNTLQKYKLILENNGWRFIGIGGILFIIVIMTTINGVEELLVRSIFFVSALFIFTGGIGLTLSYMYLFEKDNLFLKLLKYIAYFSIFSCVLILLTVIVNLFITLYHLFWY